MATLSRSPLFNAWNDATSLRQAMKGLGTNESEIISILTKRTNEERLEIQSNYYQQFGRDLSTDLKSELGGNFEKVITALLEPIEDFLARELNRAVVGLGTDDSDIQGIICTMSSEEIRKVSESYEKHFGVSLSSVIQSDTSGDYKRLLHSLITVPRGGSDVDQVGAESAAGQLYDAGEGGLGTDERIFIQILTQNSFPQLKLIFNEYEKISGKILLQSIQNEMSGDLKKSILLIDGIRLIKGLLPLQFLRYFCKSQTFSFVWRSEKDLEFIKKEYAELYGKSLVTDIKNETSGYYQNSLLYIIQGNQTSS